MMLVLSNFVKNQVKHIHKNDFWLLMKVGYFYNRRISKIYCRLVRRARKYYLGVSINTQQANDFLTSEYGKAIASQSSLRILMRQDTQRSKKSHQNLI